MCVLLHMCTFHTCTSSHVLPRDVYFHEMCASLRRVHYMTPEHGPHKHVTGMHCSIVVVTCIITCVKMKLQLSSSIYEHSLTNVLQHWYMKHFVIILTTYFRTFLCSVLCTILIWLKTVKLVICLV